MIYTNSKALLSEIKHIMDLNDIPAKDLAARMNVTQQTVSKIFVNSNPRFSTLLKMCDALNIKMDISFVNAETSDKADKSL